MIRSRAFVSLIVILPMFVVGCASGGIKKPTVFVDQYNSVPADIPSQFLDRYYFLIDKEEKEFKKLLTDEDRQVFIDKFWSERDTDPTTLENEYKEEIDDRIDDIVGERFFQSFKAIGLLFRSNGGFQGDMARVFLLHGEPDVMDTIEGHSFVPLMLWIYGNSENDRILYAFLFYQKSGSGVFKLLSQDSYQMDPCGAIYEIATLRLYSNVGGSMQGCPDDLYRVLNEIRSASGRSGVLDGYMFAWALFNFSSDPSLKMGEVFEPPKPASEIAKQSKARLIGEPPEHVGTVGINYILASCAECNSLIPAELLTGERLFISGSWKNFDWIIKGEYLELSLEYRIIFQNHITKPPIILEGITVRGVRKKFVEENQEAVINVDLLDLVLIDSIPAGTYQVSVYVKNMLTKKYNAWTGQFVKKY